jgi:clan AA aspartic protease
MITGVVNGTLEAVVQMNALDPSGQSVAFEAVIDTDFSGFLTLPASLIVTLQLRWLGRQDGILADGQIHVFDVFVATIIWDNQARLVEVDAADAEPLLGMNLLRGHKLEIEVMEGGNVSIYPVL